MPSYSGSASNSINRGNWQSLTKDDSLMREHLSRFEGAQFDAEWSNWHRDYPEETAAEREAERIFNEADPLADAILSIQPRTLAGFAVVARALAVSNSTRWHEGDEDSVFNHRGLKRLIEAT
jgi:hypothetical protein